MFLFLVSTFNFLYFHKDKINLKNVEVVKPVGLKIVPTPNIFCAILWSV